MRKRNNDLNRVLCKGILAVSLITLVLPGCEKKPEPPPVQVQVKPLPKREVMGASSTSRNLTAGKGGVASTAVATGQSRPAIEQKGTANVAPANTPAAAANQTAAKPGVQQQVSTVRLTPPSGGISLDFTNRRDPFRPYIQPQTAPKAGAAGTSKSISDLLPIQRFDTDRFKVVGIIAGIRENSALVIDPNGKGYVVKAGMLLGSNDGRIKNISASAVEVEESYRDDNGRVRKRVVRLALTRKR